MAHQHQEGPIIRRAGVPDSAAVVRLARDFHAEDDHPLSESGVAALNAMLEPESDNGRVYVVEQDGVIIGYAVLCFGHSVEYGGRDAFVDDIYIVPAARKRGLGSRLYDVLDRDAKACGCRALHLEVMPNNPMMAWYQALGYAGRGSALLTKRLEDGAEGSVPGG